MTDLPGHRSYPHLFSPLAIGSMRLANRFAMAPLTTNYANPDGTVSDALVDYLALRGAGGFGLVVTENLGVHPTGRVMPRMAMADRDEMIPGLARLADAIHATGCKVIGQLSHCGRQSKSRFTGAPLVAASPIPCPLNRDMPRELATDEVPLMARAFVEAAVRVEAAGMDGVEVHAAHGYLPSGFLSAYSNRRVDRYGGSLGNRMRFLLEIVDGIVARVKIPVTVRISAEEYVQDGNTLADTTRIARELEAHGAAAISVSVGVYETFNLQSMVTGEDEGRWLPLAAEIKREVKVPVFGVGRVKRPELAEQAIAMGMCDIPLFGRAAIADPALPLKVARGEEHRIMWCLSCNVCLGRASRPETICPVNPGVGRDRAYAAMLETKTAQPKRVAVVGSGLAALSAAQVAAARGHAVTVYEPADAVGGMQAWRAAVPGQAEYAEVIDAAVNRAEAAGASIVKAAPGAGEYDVLWVTRHYQPGTTRDIDAYDVLAGRMPARAAPRFTVVGQDLASAEAGLRLASDGAMVTVLSPGADLALDAHPGYRAINRRLLDEAGAAVRTGTLPEGRLLEGRVVRGHPIAAPIAFGEDQGWAYPYGATADAFIDDAYEPGLMTRGIYDAVALAGRLE